MCSQAVKQTEGLKGQVSYQPISQPTITHLFRVCNIYDIELILKEWMFSLPSGINNQLHFLHSSLL